MTGVPTLTGLAAALDAAHDAMTQAVAVLRWYVQDSPHELTWHGVADPADLPVSAADRLLLAAHERALGRPLERSVACPDCGEISTLPLGRADVGEHNPHCAWSGPGGGVREPTYADLSLLAGGGAAALLGCCAYGSGGDLADLARVEGSLCGPLRSTCIRCTAPLVDDVDVMALVLDALSVVRADLDREIHLLASGYGWDLATIEALPDARRRRLADLLAGTAA